MKKMYIEPEMKIVTVDAEMALLSSSGEEPSGPSFASEYVNGGNTSASLGEAL